jgi:hypothetical protein
MLTLAKLGFHALSRLAKEQDVECPCIYRGHYHPHGVPYEHAHVITDSTILSEGYWCEDCHCEVTFFVYGWSWKEGLHKANFSPNVTLGKVIADLLILMPSLSHIAIMEVHSTSNILWVYRYDKEKL